MKHTAWAVKDSKDNALATTNKVADEVGRSHHITGVYASYSAAKTGLLQIKVGTTVIFEHYVVNSLAINFTLPIQCAPGQPVSAELAASGTAGQIGKVNLVGFTY
jgi:hypothetical protein